VNSQCGEGPRGFVFISSNKNNNNNYLGHALYVGCGLKRKKKNFFHKSKQEKQGVPQNSCDLIMIMVLNKVFKIVTI
jgi:hypothetical protein